MNVLHAAYTDEALAATAANPSAGPGYQRAAGYLLRLADPEVRALAASEGHIRSNVTGCRYADGVDQAVRRYLDYGDFPYGDANREMLAREKAARDPRSGPVIEPLDVAFGHLPHAEQR